MNYGYRFLCNVVLLTLLAAFTAEQSGGKNNKKQSINLSGTLTTQSGKTYPEVENINIAGMIENIRFFEIPDTPAGALNYDPHVGTVFTEKLDEGTVIEVLKPRKIWTYQRNERAAKIEYIAISFTPCDKGEKQEYIVEATRPVKCDVVKGCNGTTEMKTPFSQVERLVIEKSSPWTEFRPCPVKTKNKVAGKLVQNSQDHTITESRATKHSQEI